MLFLLGGVAVLGGFLLLVYLFVNTDPARLARNLKWTGIGVAAVAVIGLVLVPPVRELAALLFPLALSMPLLSRFRGFIDRHRAPAGGRTSTVATAFLRMSLDHDTGAMTGTVLRGEFAGMRVEEFGRGDLLALLRECRAADEEGARLLEAYLDRLHPDWRDDLGGGSGHGSAGQAGAAPGERRYDGRRGLRDPRSRPRRHSRPDQGGASPADGQAAPRSRRLGLSGNQDQPRPRRAAPRAVAVSPGRAKSGTR